MSTAAVPTLQNEPDPNVIPVPQHVSGKNTFFARLRKGMTIQVNHDPNDPNSFLHGPLDLPVTPAMAIAHMSKWEDPNAVKKWLAANHAKLIDGKPHLQPRLHKRLTPKEMMDKNVEAARQFNQAQQPGATGPAGLGAHDVNQLIAAQLRPIQAQLSQVLTALAGPELPELALEDAPVGPGVAPAPARPRSRSRRKRSRR